MNNTHTPSAARTMNLSLANTGSILNWMYANNSTAPVVGEGATILLYSDRHAYEVVQVMEDGMSCLIQRCKATRTDSYGMSEMQDYKYELNPNAPIKHLVFKQFKRNGEVTMRYQEEHSRIDFTPAYWKRLQAESGKTFPSREDIKQHLGEDVYNMIFEVGVQQPVAVVKGVTKEYRIACPVEIIFGVRDEHYDYSR
jgi:hypothetical protein